MKYWIDTEFIERPCTIDLISAGLVAEDGHRQPPSRLSAPIGGYADALTDIFHCCGG